MESIAADNTTVWRLTGDAAGNQGLRTLPPAGLVRWSHPAAPRGRALVLLADGTTLARADDWLGGAPLTLGENELTLASVSFGSLAVPRRQVAAILFHPPEDRMRRQQVLDRAAATGGREDRLWLANGDELAGTITHLDAETIRLATAAGELSLETPEVLAAVFNPSLLERGRGDAARLLVGLGDGSLIRAASVVANDQSLEIESAGGWQFTGGTADRIAYLQNLTAGLQYVSDMQPADYRHTPYLDLTWPLARDRNLRGGPLEVGGNLYPKGLAMHSSARAVYLLSEPQQRLQGALALDDLAGDRGSVVYRVLVARGGNWENGFTSGIIRGGEPPEPFSVDLEGAEAMALVVEYADRGDELDHANWLDLRLVK